MRVLIFFFLITSSVNILSAQNSEDIYCAHARSASASTMRQAAAAQNPAMNNYDVSFYFLDIEADNLSTAVKGNVSITAKVVAPLSQFVVELNDDVQVDSVYINDIKLSFTHSQNEITVTLNSPLAVDELFEAIIYYQGIPSSAGFFAGISSAISGAWGNKVTWTLSEPLNAKDWFPCKQVLEDKADSANIFITVPNHLKAGSNGILTNTVALPNDRLRFEWKTRYPIAYYLISMTIAQYVDYSYYVQPAGSDPILVQNFVYDNPATLPNFKNDIDEVGDIIELFSEKFGLYPFHEEKYGHCMAPFSGGMEHQTMTSLGFFNFTLDAHELAHQWFGDNVTCGTWRDIWVNEGFARYSEYIATQNLHSQPEADTWLSGIQTSAMSLPGGSIYVPALSAEDENRIFDSRLTYNKGASVIHMIRNIVNDDEIFFDLLRTYQNEFARDVATGEDFKNLLESKSGIDFDEFFEDWYYGEGYPTYEIEWNHFNDSLFVKQKQLTSHPSVSLFEVPLEYKLLFNIGDSVVRFAPTQNEEMYQIYMPKPVTYVSVDPKGWLLKKVNKVARNTKLTGSTVVVGTDAEEDNSVSVYPNPTAGNVIISRQGNEVFNFVLMDMNGRPLIRRYGVHQKTELNVGGLGQGLYILQIAVNGRLHTRKLKIE